MGKELLPSFKFIHSKASLLITRVGGQGGGEGKGALFFESTHGTSYKNPLHTQIKWEKEDNTNKMLTT